MKRVTLWCMSLMVVVQAVNICPQPAPPQPFPIEEEEIPARINEAHLSH
jgi:hypothetical protein